MSLRIRSQASRICSACAVSTTSDEVRPKCSQRAAGPDVLGDRGRERDDVVLRRLLDLVDARDVERAPSRAARARRRRGRCRPPPSRRPRRARPRARSRSGAARSRSRPSRGGCSAGSFCRRGSVPSTCQSQQAFARSVAASAGPSDRRRRARRSRTDPSATRCTSSAVTRFDAGERLVEAEVPVEVDLLPRQVRHPARRCSRGSASGCP